jgi:glycolate oxidase
LKGVAGYDLTALVVGSEGTLGVVTRMTVRLRPLPPEIRTLLAYFPTVEDGARAVADLSTSGTDFRASELIDAFTLQAARASSDLRVPPGTGAALLLEIDGEGDDGALDAPLEAVWKVLERHRAEDVVAATSERERRDLWETRRKLSASVKEGRGHWISEDVGVPRARLPDLVAAIGGIRESSGLELASYGHAGEGNLHVNILFDDPADRPRAIEASEAVFRVALDLGGTISAEHGIGAAKRRYLAWEQADPVISLQRELKRVFDPANLMNPGKVLP